jgi:stearoyl-CoA desaturase (delta-9 desaturase)
MIGELYQNNHHKKPNDINFAVRLFELDFGFLISALLKKIRIIY